jgi:hypothetical protein
MSVQPLGLVILILGLMTLVRGPSFAFAIFIPCTLLGSAAVVTSDTLSIQPAHLMLGFVLIAVFSRRQYLITAFEGLSYPLPGFWLLCTMLYGVIGAFLFPRILAGITEVNAIGRSDFGLAFYSIPLGPTSGNFTQSVYFCSDVLCFLLCYAYARNQAGFYTIFRALIYYSIGNILFAALDIATFWTGTAYLLDFIRNSTYVLQTDTVVLGLKRIIGSFTEASSFANATIGVLGFTGRLWLLNIMPSLTFPISLISFLLLVFSTSTTAYATLPVLLFYLYFGSIWGLIKGRLPSSSMGFLLISPLLLATVVVSIGLFPSIVGSISDFTDVVIFDKSSSQSGIERGMINEVALNNFFETFGLGTGIGSARASSFVIASLANLGALGTVTYGLFLYKLLAVSKPASDQIVIKIGVAARTACFGLLCASMVSGALIDLGLPFFVFAGLGCAVPLADRAHAGVSVPLGNVLKVNEA